MASRSKQVYFNVDKDKKLLEFADDLPNFSDWVKEKIRGEIQRLEVEKQVNQKLADLIDQPKGEEKKKTLTWKL